MSQVYIRGPICGVDNCTSRLYRSADGLKICQYGHVMEGNVEINDDQDDNFVQTRRLNIQLTGVGGDFLQRKSQSKGVSVDMRARLYGEEAREQYILCLQVILVRQIDIIWRELINDDEGYKHVEQEYGSIVKAFWVKILRHLLGDGVKDPQDDIILTNEATIIDERLPTSKDLVSILYLAALELGLPIYGLDFVKGIRSNAFPYMKSAYLVPKLMIDRLPTHYIKLLEPQMLPKDNSMYEWFLNTYDVLSGSGNTLKSPDISHYYPLIFKIYTRVLLLPNAPEIFLAWTKIMGSIGLTTVEFPGPVTSKRSKTARIVQYPELLVVASSILALKLFLVRDPLHPMTLNGFRIDDSRFDVVVWLNNLVQYEHENEFPVPVNVKVDPEDVLSWSDAKINRYCQWIYQNFIPKKTKNDNEDIYVDEELSIMEKRLYQIFEIDDIEVDRRLGKGDHSTTLKTILELYGANKPFKKALLVKELAILDDFLIGKISSEFGVTKGVMEQCCLVIEDKLLKK